MYQILKNFYISLLKLYTSSDNKIIEFDKKTIFLKFEKKFHIIF